MGGLLRTYALENGVHEASVAVVDEARRQKSSTLALILELSLVVEL